MTRCSSSFDASVTMAKTLGARHGRAALDGPSEHRTDAGAGGRARQLQPLRREQLKKAGLGFAYHNHDFEFTNKPGGTSLYDRLLEDTDPALVKIELDLYLGGRMPARAWRR